jgi:type IV pilus assembly protein PilN
MIRINLLPFRAARKKENIRRQVSVYFLTVIFMFVLMGYFYFHFSSTLNGIKTRQNELNAELKKYEQVLKTIAELEKKIKEIKAKLAVIKDLEMKKTGPVYLLEEISKAVPKDKLWLSGLKESGGALELKGTAMDNETVALFMTNLEKSAHIQGVELQSTRMRNIPEYKLNVSDFVLQCKTYAFKDKTVDTKKPRSRR